ncbi:MAG: diguanylate cyclase [Clostridia bacterium]|nr:diguanylate cyclase [Clostridia bacterium]
MKHSLRTKTVLLIVLIAFILSAVSTVVSTQVIRRLIDTSYQERATDISETIAAVLDVEKAAWMKDEVMAIFHATDEKVSSDAWGTPEFDAYIALYSHLEQSEEFAFLRRQLRAVQDVNDVDCVYLSTLDIPTESFIYLVDAAYEEECPPGCIDPLYEENRELLNDPSIGFLPYITNTEPYGWLVTAGVPVYGADGDIICYAMVDVSMDYIRAQQTRFTLIYCLILVALTVLISLLSIWAVNRTIIHPINLLSSAAAHYSAQQDDNSELDRLPIKSKDEIQSLYSSLLKMVQNTRSYIDSLKETKQELTRTRIEADEMNELAHKDALTGVGSKLAYDQQKLKLTEEMRQGNARYGIVMVDMNDLKRMNDTYGHERGNDAIRNTCSLICDVFAHSPVYRFGGDEFVVVVKGRDYDNIEELIQKFHGAVQASDGQPWEKVNAAVGYALYNGEDTVDDVFRSADHLMYEQKKEMKAKNPR